MSIIEKLGIEKPFYGIKSEAYQRLEETAPEMLEALIQIRSGLLPYEDESGVRKVSLHRFPLLEPIIKKATGKTWEEIKELTNE